MEMYEWRGCMNNQKQATLRIMDQQYSEDDLENIIRSFIEHDIIEQINKRLFCFTSVLNEDYKI